MFLENKWTDRIRRFLPGSPETSAQRGMTLIEIIIVIAILASLMAVLVRNFTGSAERAKEDQVRIQMSNIAQSLNTFRIDNNKYPTTEQGLQSLLSDPGGLKRWRGPYIEPNQVENPWGEKIRYECSNGLNYKLISSTSTPGKEVFYPEEAASAQPAVEQEGAGGAAQQPQ